MYTILQNMLCDAASRKNNKVNHSNMNSLKIRKNNDIFTHPSLYLETHWCYPASLFHHGVNIELKYMYLSYNIILSYTSGFDDKL